MADNKVMQPEYSMFADVWKLFKKYYGIPRDSISWEEVLRDSRDIEHQYNSQLCTDLLVTVIMELERKNQLTEDEQ